MPLIYADDLVGLEIGESIRWCVMCRICSYHINCHSRGIRDFILTYTFINLIFEFRQCCIFVSGEDSSSSSNCRLMLNLLGCIISYNTHISANITYWYYLSAVRFDLIGNTKQTYSFSLHRNCRYATKIYNTAKSSWLCVLECNMLVRYFFFFFLSFSPSFVSLVQFISLLFYVCW